MTYGDMLTQAGDVRREHMITAASILATIAEMQRARDPGEIVIMLAKNYGWTWSTIPIDRIDEAAQFIKTMWHRRYLIIDPELYNSVRNNDALYTTTGYPDGFK